MAANLNIFKTSKNDYILSKVHFSFAEVHCVIYTVESDKKIKVLMIWALEHEPCCSEDWATTSHLMDLR